MADREHLSEDALRALVLGADLVDSAGDVLGHLLGCSACRARLKGLQVVDPERGDEESLPGLSSFGQPDPRTFEAAFFAARSLARAESERCEREACCVPALLAELDRYKPTQRRLLVRNAPRFANSELVRALLDRSRQAWAADPLNAEQDAAAACEILETVQAEGFRLKLVNDLRAEAWSYLANCRRIRFDLRGASMAFERAEEFLVSGTGDLREKAQLLDLEVSFLRERRDFGRAEELLGTVIESYRSLSDDHMVGRALVSKAKLVGDRGDVEVAVALLLQAAPLVDGQRDPHLVMLLNKNLMVNLTQMGRLAQARALLPEVRRLVRAHGNRLDRLRSLWVEGVLRRELGEVEFAEEAMKQAQAGFLAAGIVYDAALVSFDLAILYLRTGRSVEVQELAAECYAVASSNAVEREALAALLVFHQAVEQEVATVSLVKELISSVQRTPSVSHLREREA